MTVTMKPPTPPPPPESKISIDLTLDEANTLWILLGASDIQQYLKQAEILFARDLRRLLNQILSEKDR